MSDECEKAAAKEVVAMALENAGVSIAELTNHRNVELMTPSEILVSVANVLDNAAKELRE